MKQINEELSISNDVVNLSDLIADKILIDAPKQRKQISSVNHAIFVENNLTIDLYGEIKGLSHLTVHYILYIFDTLKEYSLFLRNVIPDDNVKNYNSWSDYNESFIQIVSCYVNGKIYRDFVEGILHEITHLYQYGQGMQKRENLYNEVIKMCSATDYVASSVGRTVYYTFNHEQDAMVHQFYGYLLQEKPFGNWDDIIENSELGNAMDVLYIVNNNKQKAVKFIKQLGFSVSQWNKRIHFGYIRFKQKLFNAYKFYQSQKTINLQNESHTFEINLTTQIEFDKYWRKSIKKYGNIDFGTETIYSMWKN